MFVSTHRAVLMRLLALFLLAFGTVVNAEADEGIRFSCAPERLRQVEAGMSAYLSALKIAPELVIKKADPTRSTLVYTLNTPPGEVDTLRFTDDPKFALRDAIVPLPAKGGKTRKVATVSPKEILLALLQHGRLTELKGENCTLAALKELVGVRQNIVAWSENLGWVWPDGDPAEWNTQYWREGTPLPKVSLHTALNDVFFNQRKYSIGCYTAAKLVVAQGILDYYSRVKKNPAREQLVEARLASDRDPLVDIEPGKMWSFEKDFDPHEMSHPGKLLQIQYGVAPKNLVPGDWIYILNTDPVSAQKTGYEGSSAIYLGRGKFSDYFNDNGHSYTYQEKLNEVYQWRNGVFNRIRDREKVHPLSQDDYEKLGKPPASGGLMMDFRVFPHFFTQSELPELKGASLSD